MAKRRKLRPGRPKAVAQAPWITTQSSAQVLQGSSISVLQAYSARISKLRRFAAQDDEYELNPASESDFWHFVESEPRWRKGSLVLMDNGNLRVVWKDSQGSHLGLQFLGSEAVQYVIFRQRAVMRPISRVAGRDTFAGLKKQIDAFELESLLYE